MIGIYKIENLINHKIYIGQSIHIERRWCEHCRPTNHSLIAKAIKKYGKENFSFSILLECSIDELDKWEQFYIYKFNTIVPNGYNIKDCVEGQQNIYFYYDKETLKNIVSDIKENKMSFQLIGEKYDLSTRTIYFINNGDVHRQVNEKYPLRPVKDMKKKIHICPICGQEMSKGATKCRKCANKQQERADRPEREELKILIRTLSFVEIGKRYGVSDNTIRKWCKRYGLPFKKTDINKINDEEWLSI